MDTRLETTASRDTATAPAIPATPAPVPALSSDDLRIRVSDLELDKQQAKLVKRIRNVTTTSPTVGAILAMDPTRFRKQFFGIGGIYEASLLDLQKKIFAKVTAYRAKQRLIPVRPVVASLPPEVTAHLFPSYGFLGASYELVVRLARMWRLPVHEVSVQRLLAVDGTGFGVFSRQRARALRDLQDRIRQSLTVGYAPVATGIATPNAPFLIDQPETLSLSQLDAPLCTAIDPFVKSQSPRLATLLCRRIGWRTPAATLADVARERGISRERVRQIQDQVEQAMRLALPVHCRVLRKSLETSGAFREDIGSELPLLFSCFASPHNAMHFLETHSGWKCLLPSFDEHVLDTFLVTTSSPASADTVLSYMIRQGMTPSRARACLDELATQGAIRRDAGGNILPCRLNQSVAMVYVLAMPQFREGAHWREIVMKANEVGCSASRFKTHRLPPRIRESPLIYICGHGRYRHIKYLPTVLNRKRLLLLVRRALDANSGVRVLRLREDIYLPGMQAAAPKARWSVDYWALRYVVQTDGPAHGLYFNGQSMKDVVSLSKKAAREYLSRKDTRPPPGRTPGNANTHRPAS